MAATAKGAAVRSMQEGYRRLRGDETLLFKEGPNSPASCPAQGRVEGIANAERRLFSVKAQAEDI